jgi:hypothetical protein
MVRTDRYRSVVALALAVGVLAGCSSILGINEPTLENPPADAAPDTILSGCAPGPCCSASGFEPTTKACGAETTEFQCAGTCGGHPQKRTTQQFCSGTSSACDGAVVTSAFADLPDVCTASQVCELGLGQGAPQCTACQFGCDNAANACRAGKLGLYLSAGGFVGNMFGGTDSPPDVRETADGKCRDTAASMAGLVPCTPAHAHAVLFVSGSDSIAGMSTHYGIPTTVPVHRADDDVFLFSSWNEVINSTTPATRVSSPSAAMTMDLAVIWTGAGEATHCLNWTSGATGVNGVRGDTSLVGNTGWLGAVGGFRCDRPARLLCVCWPGD